MKKLRSLSIFFPAYNDAQSIPSLIQKADTVAQGVSQTYEILVINDGSKDNTSEVVKKLQKKYPQLRLIEHKKNKGYGGALISGFTHAKHEWVFYTDGDGQYDPAELALLTKKVSPDVDVVNGYKVKRNDALIRKIIGNIYVWVLHTLYHPPIRDVDCDFRLIKNELVQSLDLRSQSGLICLELVLKLQKNGARFREIGVHHFDRKYGSSQFFHPKHLAKTFADHLRFYLTNYSSGATP